MISKIFCILSAELTLFVRDCFAAARNDSGRSRLLRRSREPAESGRSVEKKMKSSLNAPRDDNGERDCFVS